MRDPKFCNHLASQFGLCVECGAILTEAMKREIVIFNISHEKSCPGCVWSRPDSLYQGKPVDWFCDSKCEFCADIWKYGGGDCQAYKKREVHISAAPI